MDIQVTRMESLSNLQLITQWRASTPGTPREVALWAEIVKRWPS